MLCILLASSTLIGLWALPRMALAYKYANQFAGSVGKKDGAEETNWELVLYSDPDPAGMILPLFQYVALNDFEWHGTTKDSEGNDIGVDVLLGTVMFDQGIPYPDPNLMAGDVDFHLTIAPPHDTPVADILVRAENLLGRVDFGFNDEYGMNALNVTAVLEGEVELSVFVTILPFPGLARVLYSYTGERIRFSMLVVKPIEVSVETPSDGARVQGDQEIVATVATAKGISAENVRWEVDEQWGPMHYDEGSGLWRGVWPSYHTGNGWHNLVVKADGVERKPGYEFRYPAEARINVEVDNPWVVAYVVKDGWKEEFGLEIGTPEGPRWTSFHFWPWVDYTLQAPEYWMDGSVRFRCWVIEGTEISGNPTLTFNATLLEMLVDGGSARQLECIYEPTG